jgi:hypothetical protein
MSTLEAKAINGLGKGFGVYRRDHRFKEFSLAVCASKITMTSRHTDCCKTVFVKRKRIVMIRHSAGE